MGRGRLFQTQRPQQRCGQEGQAGAAGPWKKFLQHLGTLRTEVCSQHHMPTCLVLMQGADDEAGAVLPVDGGYGGVCPGRGRCPASGNTRPCLVAPSQLYKHEGTLKIITARVPMVRLPSLSSAAHTSIISPRCCFSWLRAFISKGLILISKHGMSSLETELPIPLENSVS